MKNNLIRFVKTIGLISGGVIIIFIIMLICTFLLWAPDCENTIYQSILSPDGAHKAILYTRDCGATTGFGTNISLAKANENIDTGFRIFTADDDHGKANLHSIHPELIDISVRWIDDHLLEISYDKNARLFTEKYKVGGITIVHRKR